MNDISTNVQDLYKMVLGGKILEAFDKYYAKDVTMQENEDAPRIGFDANRKYEEVFVSGVTEFHGAKVLNWAVNGNVAFVESWMDFTHKDWGRASRTQVAVQTWKDGKIITEKFYYKS